MITLYKQPSVLKDFATDIRRKWINADKDLLAWTVSDIFSHIVIAVSAIGVWEAL